MSSRRGAFGAALLASALAGCTTVGPDYRRPADPVPAAFAAPAPWKEAAPGDLLNRGNWWELFSDPVLNGLQEQALRQNLRLQAAAARVDQARAIAGLADAARYPTLDFAPDAGRYGVSGNRPDQPSKLPGNTDYVTNRFRVPLYASYEIDVWGKVRRATEAADARVQASMAAYHTVALTLESEIAQTYFSLRTTDEEARILQSNLELRRKAYELVALRKRGGLASELDVMRVETELASTEAEMRVVNRRRVELQNALAVLLGSPPEELRIDPMPLALQPPSVPVGLPSDLLERRPDVAEAERLLAARNAEIGVARAAFFPSIKLTGGIGFESIELSSLLDRDSLIWSVAGSLSQPLIDGGRNRSNMARAQALYQENLAQYRERLLVAFQEVENALSGLGLLQEQYDLQSKAVSSAEKAEQLATLRYKTGLVIVLEVIDAQRTRLQSERQRLQVRNQQMLASVGLVKALGGGWQAQQLTAPRPAQASRVKIPTQSLTLAPTQ